MGIEEAGIGDRVFYVGSALMRGGGVLMEDVDNGTLDRKAGNGMVRVLFDYETPWDEGDLVFIENLVTEEEHILMQLAGKDPVDLTELY